MLKELISELESLENLDVGSVLEEGVLCCIEESLFVYYDNLTQISKELSDSVITYTDIRKVGGIV